MPSPKQWFIATRPWSFPASSMPVLVTIAYIFSTQYGTPTSVNWWIGTLCLLGAIIFHFGGNLISDYFDFKTGVDREDNTGQRFLVDGVFEAKTILIYGLVLLAIGSVIGIFIVLKSSIYVLYVGLIGLILTLLYSKLKYNALGDLCVFINFGILESIGTSFAMLNHFNLNALLCTIPVGFLVVAILHANNTRDREFDNRAHVKTLAMKMGLKASKIYYAVLVFGAYIMNIVLDIIGITGIISLLPLLTIGMACKNINMMHKCEQASDIASLDGRSAQLVLWFSLALIASLVLTPWLP